MLRLLADDTDPSYVPFVTAPHLKLAPPPSLYGSAFDVAAGKWVDWLLTVPKQAISFDTEFTQITVQTIDSIRTTYLLDKLVQGRCQVAMVGPTGTGKTLYTKNFFSAGLDKEAWGYMNLTFSAQTTANQTQVSKLSKWTWWTHTGGGKAPAFKPTPNATRWCRNNFNNIPRSRLKQCYSRLGVLARPPELS